VDLSGLGYAGIKPYIVEGIFFRSLESTGCCLYTPCCLFCCL